MRKKPPIAQFRRRYRRKAAFSVLSIFLFLFLIEFISRAAESIFLSADRNDSPLSMQQLPDQVLNISDQTNRLCFTGQFSDRLLFLTHPKQENTYRVFVFGGSAAKGLGFPHNGSFAYWLDRMLRTSLPSRNIEVANLASVGYSSAQVRRLVDEVLAKGDPDLIVVYSGNNEFLDVKAKNALRGSFPRLSDRTYDFFMDKTAVVRLFSLIRPQKKSLDETARKALTEYIQAPITKAQRTRVFTRYRRNLERIAQSCAEKNTPLVLCTLIANPITDLTTFHLNNIDIETPWNNLHLNQAYGWARLRRWDLAEKALAPIARFGPRLDLLRLYEAGGIQAMELLSEDARQHLRAAAAKVLAQMTGENQSDVVAQYTRAICYKLLERDKDLRALLEKVLSSEDKEEQDTPGKTTTLFAQFTDNQTWKNNYLRHWQHHSQNDLVANPQHNDIVREVSSHHRAILADLDRELPCWYDPSPARFLLDYCHFNIEGAFQTASFIYRKLEEKGVLPEVAKSIDFEKTLLLPDLEYLRSTAHDFAERERWMGLNFRVCYAYCRPLPDESIFQEWFEEDRKKSVDEATINAFESAQRWYRGRE